MSVSRALRTSLAARGLVLKDVNIPYGQSMKSMIKGGQRSVAKDVAPMLARSVRHPAMVMALAKEFSGGYGSVWLDGPNLDIHRSSVKERAVIEIQEALEALVRFRSGNPPETMTDSDRHKLGELLTELLDARQWIDFCAAVFCEDYGKDFLGVNEDHHRRLKSMRLVTE